MGTIIRKTSVTLIACLCGIAGAWGWFYINDVSYRVPAPSMGRLPYLLVQVPPLWYVWITSGLFLLLLAAYILGRAVKIRDSRARAMEKLHWKTRDTIKWWKGRAMELEGQAMERTAERDAMNSMAQEFHSQLIAIDKIRTFRPRNEIVERKLLDMNNA
jgi:hypothetical protein